MWRLVLVALLACKSKTQQSPPAPEPSHDDPWTDIRVPGASVFTLHGDHVAYLVRDGATDHLRGNDAMRVVVDSKLTDPTQLATFSELFSERVAGRVVRSPADAGSAHGAERVTAPAIKDGLLTYWAVSGDALHRAMLDLGTLERDSEGVGDLEVAADPVGTARKRLASNDASVELAAVQMLADHCNAAGAAALLVETLRSAARADTRAAAATALETCPGDLAAARDALTRAASDPDETVSYAAKGALARLP